MGNILQQNDEDKLASSVLDMLDTQKQDEPFWSVGSKSS